MRVLELVAFSSSAPPGSPYRSRTPGGASFLAYTVAGPPVGDCSPPLINIRIKDKSENKSNFSFLNATYTYRIDLLAHNKSELSLNWSFQVKLITK